MTIESQMIIDDNLDFRKSNTVEGDQKEFQEFEVYTFKLAPSS